MQTFGNSTGKALKIFMPIWWSSFIPQPQHMPNILVKYMYRSFYVQFHGAGTTCNVQLTVPKTMHAPILFYYGLDNFQQNHRR